jgi:hypothetical protein
MKKITKNPAVNILGISLSFAGTYLYPGHTSPASLKNWGNSRIVMTIDTITEIVYILNGCNL